MTDPDHFSISTPRQRAQAALGRFSLYFAPSIFSAALSFVMLPLATRIVGPREYGIFALVNAYIGFGTALATIGGNYIITPRFVSGSQDDRVGAASTVTILSFAVVSLYGALLYTVWNHLPGTALAPLAGLLIALLAMVIGQPWMVAADVLTIQGNAAAFAITAMLQSIGSAAALLSGLFYFHLGVLAFFLSQLSSAVIGLLGAAFVLRKYFRFRVDRSVLHQLRSLGLISALGNMAESFQTAVERTTLSSHVGVTQLGIYSNSQAYRSFAAMPIGAVSKSVWPPTVEDAMNPAASFERTREAWNITYIGITFAGIFLATLGDRLIGGLTHGKFTEAYVLATFWMAYLLVQNSGKPQTGILYALGGGRTYARIVVSSIGVAIVALFILVPLFGTWGAVGAATVQQIALRAGIQVAARRYRTAPFQDGWALFGVIYIAVIFAVRQYFEGPLAANLTILGIAVVVLITLSRKPLFAPIHRIIVNPAK